MFCKFCQSKNVLFPYSIHNLIVVNNIYCCDYDNLCYGHCCLACVGRIKSIFTIYVWDFISLLDQIVLCYMIGFFFKVS